MSNVLAKTMAAVSVFLFAATIAVLFVTSRPPAGSQQVVAEFRNAFPLLEGMYVRVDGAVAGSVGKIEVTDEGLASVTLVLDETIERAGADATAAIRQQDTTGDSYVAFEPGASSEPLPEVDGDPTIPCDAPGPQDPCKNSLASPRFDDLLNAFGPPERAGVQLVLSDLSRALDERGTDLNAAALELRPALVEANEALAEVGTQNAALRPLIEDAEAVTGQAASKRQELGRMIASLDSTLGVVTEEGGALDAGLERLPDTTARAQTTLAALAGAAEAGVPLAEEIRAGAPGVAAALRSAPGFLDAAGETIDDVQPTLKLTRRLLEKGAPTIKADPERVVTGAFDLAPAISNLLTGVLGDENTIRALFGDDSGGVGPGTLDRFGLGAVSVEPGNQEGYPASHANRNFFRISAVLNCTMFGAPVEPGCLVDVLTAARARAAGEPAAKRGSASRGNGGGGRSASPGAPGGSEPTPGAGLPDVGDLGDAAGLKELEDLLDIGKLGDRGKDGGKDKDRGNGRGGAGTKAVQDLLDFLMG